MGFIMKNAGHLLNTIPTMVEENFPKDFKEWMDSNVVSKWNAPSVNILEKKDAYILEVAAPGFRKEDFNISYKNEHLVISAERRTSEEEVTEDKGKYTRREFSYGRFERTFKLLEKWIEKDKIQAKYQDGILNITVSKKAEGDSENEHKIVVE